MPPTLARRYFFKLVANIASVPVYLVMEAILPRALGPQTYGNYSFATNLFQQLAGFLDMGTSTCFYNSLSRRQQELPLFAFYMRICLGVAVLLGLAGLCLLWAPAGSIILPDAPSWLAPLAAAWAFLTWWGRVLRSVNDALGVTIPSELWRAFLSVLGVAVLCGLFWSHCLDVASLFIQQYILLGATCVAYWHVCFTQWNRASLRWKLARTESRAYVREFFDYSHPLFIQSLLSFCMLAAERWLLQWFDGSAQQGFYALSQKVGMACFLFVSAMTPLLMRELSIAWGSRDLEAMGSLLKRFAPLLYSLAAYFSCFTMVEAKAVVELFGGNEFLGATAAVQIMAFYPLHQAYGQMAGAVFHASGRTRILRNMAALECIYGLAAAWLLIAPADLFGLNLGALGLAIKTVGTQFVTVNLYLWLASRMVPISFWANLCHQLWSVAALLGCACLSCYLSSQFGPLDDSFLLRFLLSGVLYTGLVATMGVACPQLVGMSRTEARELVARLKLHWHRKHTN